MYIKGIPDYNKNGEKRETGLFAGLVSQDGELRQTQNGKQYAQASVRAFNRKDGTAAFMSLKTFSGDLVPLISNLRKGDRVLAAGTVESREYNGKTYTDMLVDFLISADTMHIPSSAQQAANRADLANRMNAVGSNGFAEIGEEDFDGAELPF